MKVGSYEVTTLAAESFRLDGGAMFGVVPRPLWERTNPPDERNRILLAARVLLLRGEGRVAIVDAGVGDKDGEKFRDIYAIRREPGLPEALAAAGIASEHVTDVILTHLHFDHGGGSTRREGERVVPAFPRATYHVQRANLEHARRPNERDRASYLPENFEPLATAGVLQVYDGDGEILPGVFARVINGHTPGQQMVAIGEGAGSVVFSADLVPTSAHLPIPYVMGYDLEPLRSMEEKRRWLPEWSERGTIIVFDHDPDIVAARIEPGPRGAHRVAERIAL